MTPWCKVRIGIAIYDTKILAMIQAYLDESGIHEGAVFLCALIPASWINRATRGR
jgi:hypothetical protein